jgi:hypothetical protein
MSSVSHVLFSNDENRQKYQLTAFVETGCHLGDGLSYARSQNYKKLYSCDINVDHVNKCKTRFPEAELFHGESIPFLESLLPSLNERTLFWLDAHFPKHYGFSETEESKAPLLKEIALIKKLKTNYQHDIIMCDDMRIYRSPKNIRYHQNEIDESYWTIDLDWDNFIAFLSDTHDYVNDPVAQGIMVFYPK